MKRGTFVRGVGLVAAGTLSPVLARAGTLATPPGDFASNRNYFIYGGGEPIRKLRVTVHVDQDIVAPGAMSMQLNGNSPALAECVYQQYCTNFTPQTETLRIAWSIENFPSTAYRWDLHQHTGLPCNVPNPQEGTCKGNLYNYPLVKVPFTKFSGPSDRIPAGFKIITDLIDGPGGSIIGANFTIVDAQGRATTNKPRLPDNYFVRTSTKISGKGMAPNMAFQLDMVGIDNGAKTKLQSGAGTITYEANLPLTPLASMADHADVFHGAGTEEQSNIRYSKLDEGPSRKFVQKFFLAGSQHDDDRTTTNNGPIEGAACPRGQTYNSLSKSCGAGNGRIISNDKAPPLQQPR